MMAKKQTDVRKDQHLFSKAPSEPQGHWQQTRAWGMANHFLSNPYQVKSICWCAQLQRFVGCSLHSYLIPIQEACRVFQQVSHPSSFIICLPAKHTDVCKYSNNELWPAAHTCPQLITHCKCRQLTCKCICLENSSDNGPLLKLLSDVIMHGC